MTFQRSYLLALESDTKSVASGRTLMAQYDLLRHLIPIPQIFALRSVSATLLWNDSVSGPTSTTPLVPPIPHGCMCGLIQYNHQDFHWPRRRSLPHQFCAAQVQDCCSSWNSRNRQKQHSFGLHEFCCSTKHVPWWHMAGIVQGGSQR